MPVSARDVNTIGLLLAAEVDPKNWIDRSFSPWVCSLRQLSQNWMKLNLQSKQIAYDIICELVQRGAHIHIQDEEDHLLITSSFAFVRNKLEEPITAWRL